MQQQMVWLSGLLPYAQVEQVFARLTGQMIPDASIWVEAQRVGQRLCEQMAQQRQQVSVERTQWEHRRYDPHARKSVAFDGGMVHIRQEGWKELKVGVVSDLTARGQPLHQNNALYTAVLGDVVAFRPALWALAVQSDLPYAGDVVVIADGAAWIWRLAADLFPCSVQIVDWYHACQHLAQAAAACFPEDEKQARTWYEHMREHLFMGRVWCIVVDLQQHDLADQATYFQTHQRRMQYHELRGDCYPIGSGNVESGVKQFKQRLSGPGMHWSRPGAERMVALRTAILSRQFDRLWQPVA
jgi:hypothetical protein